MSFKINIAIIKFLIITAPLLPIALGITFIFWPRRRWQYHNHVIQLKRASIHHYGPITVFWWKMVKITQHSPYSVNNFQHHDYIIIHQIKTDSRTRDKGNKPCCVLATTWIICIENEYYIRFSGSRRSRFLASECTEKVKWNHSNCTTGVLCGCEYLLWFHVHSGIILLTEE